MKLNISLLPKHIQFAFTSEYISTARAGYRDFVEAEQNGSSFNQDNGGPINSKHHRAYGIGASIAATKLSVDIGNSRSFTNQIREALGLS